MADLMQQIGSIDHAICEARYGSPATLAAVAATLPALTSSVTGNAAETVRAGSLQIGLNFAEMTDDAIKSHLNTLYEEADRYFAHQQQSHQEVLDVAAANGVDLRGYADTVADLRAQREAAEAKGNREAVLRLDAMIASLEAQAAREAGMSPEAVNERDTKSEEAMNRYREGLAAMAEQRVRSGKMTREEAERWQEERLETLKQQSEENSRNLGFSVPEQGEMALTVLANNNAVRMQEALAQTNDDVTLISTLQTLGRAQPNAEEQSSAMGSDAPDSQTISLAELSVTSESEQEETDPAETLSPTTLSVASLKSSAGQGRA